MPILYRHANLTTSLFGRGLRPMPENIKSSALVQALPFADASRLAHAALARYKYEKKNTHIMFLQQAPRKCFAFPRSRQAPHADKQKRLDKSKLFSRRFYYRHAACCKRVYYLFENCGARRAALRPYFFLSFILGSLVKKPAFFNDDLYSSEST